MFLKQQILLMILILRKSLIIQAELHMKATKMECYTSPKYFQNHSCILKPIDRYRSVLFMETHVIKTLTNVSVRVSVYLRNDANIYNPYLIDFTGNMCDFLSKKKSGLYINIFMSIVRKYSNVNHPCPYTGLLWVKNLMLDPSTIPVILTRNTAFKFLIQFYEGYPFEYFGMAAYYVEGVESRKKAPS